MDYSRPHDDETTKQAAAMAQELAESAIRSLERMRASCLFQLQQARLKITDNSIPVGTVNHVCIEQLAKETQAKTIRDLEQQIDYLDRKRQLIRPPRSDQAQYRHKLIREFPVLVKNIQHNQPRLRFHGADIVNTERIINSRKITSAEERGLSRASFDTMGQISVTTIANVISSLKDYIGIKEAALPLGCLFVLLPKDETDAQSGRSNLMASVQLVLPDGSTSPQLVRILTSAEMLPTIRRLLTKQGINSNLATEYFAYLQEK